MQETIAPVLRPYKPHAKQIAAHLAFMTQGYKRGVLLMGRQSGKTYFSTQHGWLSAVKEQGRYFIVFKTYKQAHEVVWRQYVPLIPKELIYKKNEQDLLIEFHYFEGPVKLPDGTVIEVNHDETKPRSTLQLLGSDQADSHRGFKANGIIFDEYADQDPNNWDAVYKHFFTTTDGWAIFMGTPRGYNHFYDQIEFAKEDDRWFYLEATWRDSPYVKPEFIAEERREAEKRGTLSTFLQEVELEFRAVQGAVFPQFNRNVHIKKPAEFPPLEELSIYAGIDFGYHTTACIFVGIDRDQTWWVFDEVYGHEEILLDILPRIRDKIADQRLILMVGDSAAKDAIETMLTKGFPIVPVIKRGSQDGGGSIAHGIDLLRQKFRPRIQLVGNPKPEIFISSICKNFIREVEAYKYPEEKEDRNPSEVPQKEDDHGPDAIRYLMLHLKYGLQKDDKLPKASGLAKLNEYGL
jgi:phage terminase large subunit